MHSIVVLMIHQHTFKPLYRSFLHKTGVKVNHQVRHGIYQPILQSVRKALGVELTWRTEIPTDLVTGTLRLLPTCAGSIEHPSHQTGLLQDRPNHEPHPQVTKNW